MSTFIQTNSGQIVSRDLPLLLFWVELGMLSPGSSTANMKNKEIYNSVPIAFTYRVWLCNYCFFESYLCSLPLQTQKLRVFTCGNQTNSRDTGADPGGWIGG